MRNTIHVCICTMILGLAAVPTSAKTRVFLLAGQSNMGGLGNNAELVGSLAPYSGINNGVKIWNYNSAPQWFSLSSYVGFGPELSFGYEMQAAFPEDDIFLIKCAWGGTDLYEDWNPSGAGGTWYNNFKSTAHEALWLLGDPAIDGMLWMQGEGDTVNATYAQAYQANLTAFIAAVRNEFATPGMPFVLGRILEGYGTLENNALVRSAQETVPGLVGHAAWVNTDDLQISPTIPLHYGTEGTIELGLRFADKVVNIPEPSALLPVASGLLFLTGYLRRKRG